MYFSQVFFLDLHAVPTSDLRIPAGSVDCYVSFGGGIFIPTESSIAQTAWHLGVHCPQKSQGLVLFIFTNHFRYLKWRNPHRDISFVDTAYGYGKTHSKNSLIWFSTSILGT